MKRIFPFLVTNLAVLGHEISHVANGDMVTLALLQGRASSATASIGRCEY